MLFDKAIAELTRQAFASLPSYLFRKQSTGSFVPEVDLGSCVESTARQTISINRKGGGYVPKSLA